MKFTAREHWAAIKDHHAEMFRAVFGFAKEANCEVIEDEGVRIFTPHNPLTGAPEAALVMYLQKRDITALEAARIQGQLRKLVAQYEA